MSRRAPRPHFGHTSWRVGLVSLVLAAPLAACSASTSHSVAGRQVAVSLQDFKLTTTTTSLPAGPVTFDVVNYGPSTHQFNVDLTTLVDSHLPVDVSGLFVNEASPLLHRQGSVDSAGLGSRHRLTLTLAPGTYVVYCNLEGHYISGMHWTINVH
jgi:uncharacterized cupredoxin-like copper-binding protein